ncbi:hypothetical protein NOE36_22230 [Escherichia coli]|uniref:hypothetical protein n=1 Tax=Escherichia coli TaxID=562 RepID=UPI0021014FAB|nr:hypothetical protein [Escherichia coli]MCQ1591431.1 hypothetical protein [Escherichia coli]MCQ1597568.1 hypothetical protein [Escherichia coli]
MKKIIFLLMALCSSNTYALTITPSNDKEKYSIEGTPTITWTETWHNGRVYTYTQPWDDVMWREGGVEYGVRWKNVTGAASVPVGGLNGGLAIVSANGKKLPLETAFGLGCAPDNYETVTGVITSPSGVSWSGSWASNATNCRRFLAYPEFFTIPNDFVPPLNLVWEGALNQRINFNNGGWVLYNIINVSSVAVKYPSFVETLTITPDVVDLKGDDKEALSEDVYIRGNGQGRSRVFARLATQSDARFILSGDLDGEVTELSGPEITIDNSRHYDVEGKFRVKVLKGTMQKVSASINITLESM